MLAVQAQWELDSMRCGRQCLCDAAMSVSGIIMPTNRPTPVRQTLLEHQWAAIDGQIGRSATLVRIRSS